MVAAKGFTKKWVKRAKPRKFAAKRKYYKKRSMIPRDPFPSTALAKLRYVQYIDLNPSATIAAKNTFNLMSLYDPWQTGSGHQPYGFDQYAALYNLYNVINARITMKWLGNPAAGASSTCGLYGMLIDDDTNFFTSTIEELIERPRNKSLKNVYRYVTSNTVNSQVTLNFNPKKYFKIKSLIGESQYTSDVGTSPTNTMYAQCYFGGALGDDLPSTRFIITIDYIAVFSKPKDIGQS